MRWFVFCFACLVTTGATAEELRGLATVAVKGALEKIAPMFMEQTRDQLFVTFTSSADVVNRIKRGEQADFIIGSRAGIDDLSKEGRVIAGSDVVLATSKMGVAVREGTPMPTIATLEDMRASLKSAKAVSTSDPALGGLAGLAFAKSLERLGWTNELREKLVYPEFGQKASDLVLSGKADLVISQMSELIQPGLTIVGPLPTEMQSVQQFVFAVPTASQHKETAGAFLSFLRSDRPTSVFKAMALEPAAN